MRYVYLHDWIWARMEAIAANKRAVISLYRLCQLRDAYMTQYRPKIDPICL